MKKHYVSLEFLSTLEFCNMFRSRRDTSRVSTKSGLGEVKRGRPGSGPKVAVLCKASNNKWVTFKGGSQEGV